MGAGVATVPTMKTAGLPVMVTEDVTLGPLFDLRWRAGRSSHRPAGEPFEPKAHGLEPLDRDPARDFVATHHYAKSYPAARVAYGLYRAFTGLVGVVVFGRGMQDAAGQRYAPGVDPAHVVELQRLVLLDEIEGNAESWSVAQALRMLQADLPEVRLVLSYSDPVVRRRADGTKILPGHVGTVYQALGARYHGRGERRRLVIAPTGEVVPDRGASKLLAGDRGGPGFYERLIGWGAPRIKSGEQPAAYLDRALREGPFRCLPHPGNHVYSWALDPSLGRGPAKSYPHKQ